MRSSTFNGPVAFLRDQSKSLRIVPSRLRGFRKAAAVIGVELSAGEPALPRPELESLSGKQVPDRPHPVVSSPLEPEFSSSDITVHYVTAKYGLRLVMLEIFLARSEVIRYWLGSGAAVTFIGLATVALSELSVDRHPDQNYYGGRCCLVWKLNFVARWVASRRALALTQETAEMASALLFTSCPV
jgi:hypothetical protein